MAPAPMIVSLWRDRDRRDFLCSGLMLGPKHILTVRHAFPNASGCEPGSEPVFVRLIDGVEGHIEARLLQRHAERDAAILELTTPVRLEQPPRLLMQAAASFDGKPATLRVIDPDNFGRSELPNYAVGSFDHATGEYCISPENARGHSGGVVEIDGILVGLLSRRAKTDPLCRAVPMHLLWPWISDSLGLVPTAPPPVATSSIGPCSAAYRQLVGRVRERVREGLKQAAIERLAARWRPDPLADFDFSDPAGQLGELIGELYKATSDSIPDWRLHALGPSAEIGAEIGAEIRRQCRALASELLKLAVEPSAQGVEPALADSPPERLHVACQFPGTADVVYVALSDQPHLFERCAHGDDISSACAVHFYTEIAGGVGKDQQDELLRKLWVRVMDKPDPGQIDAKQQARLMERIRRHQGRDRRRYLLVAPGQPDDLGASGYRQSAEQFGLGLVLHAEGDCPHLLMNETELIDSLLEYLELLETF